MRRGKKKVLLLYDDADLERDESSEVFFLFWVCIVVYLGESCCYLFSMPPGFAADPDEAVGVDVSATPGSRQRHDFSQRRLRLAFARVALHHSALAASVFVLFVFFRLIQ